VISGFLGLIESDEQSRVAAENLGAQQQREGDITVLVERGSRPIADLYQQQATVAAARSTLVGAKRAQELARFALVQALRLDPAGSYDFVAPELGEPSIEEPARDVAALVQQALGQRPDIAALDTRLGAAEQSQKVAGAGRWPSLSLSVGYGANYSTNGPTGFADQLDSSRGGSLSLGLSFPVFDGLSTRLARERAAVQSDNARIALDDMRQQVALEVKRAVLDRQSAVAALDASSARVQASRRALEATEARYPAGVATLFEVTQARADFVDATSAEIRARYSLLFEDRVLDYYTGALDPANGIAL
jgi:outer membrane protein